MKKEELFDKYSIREEHSKWDSVIDNWMSVEIYKLTHLGVLPPKNNLTVAWVLDFLDKMNSDIKYAGKILHKKGGGSLYLTAKRMVYRYSDKLLETLN